MFGLRPSKTSRARPVLAVIFLAATLFSSVALAAPGVSSTQVSDIPAGSYVSDQAHTSVTAKISHLGFSSYTLRFDKVDAQFKFDPAAPEMSHVTVSIDPASIDTGSKSLDRQLAGKDWFDAEGFPKATFVSDKIDLGDGRNGTVSGLLTLHGVTKPVVLTTTFNGVGVGMVPLVTRVGFSANATIKRSDFGLDRFEGAVGDEVQLWIEVELTKKLI